MCGGEMVQLVVNAPKDVDVLIDGSYSHVIHARKAV